MVSKRNNTMVRRHFVRRVTFLENIENYIEQNGPVTITEYTMNVDVYSQTIHNYKSKGYLKTGKQGRKVLLLGVNWGEVRLNIRPDEQRESDLKIIADLTSAKSFTLHELSRQVPRTMATLRYWCKIGILDYEKKARPQGDITIVTGVAGVAGGGDAQCRTA